MKPRSNFQSICSCCEVKTKKSTLIKRIALIVTSTSLFTLCVFLLVKRMMLAY